MIALSGWPKYLGALLACAMFAAHAIAAPAQQGPQEFLDAIYQTYLGENANGIAITDPKAIRRYFTPPLAAAMIKDEAAAAKRREVATLDGDPFVDAQDWKIDDLKIAVKLAGARAVATVTFTNFGERHSMTLDLLKTPAGWRVDDIKATFGSMRKLLKVK
jgi:Protein of unknown function (DUF3828)